MKVTVLTTLYNKGPFVEEAVRSTLASTFTDLEVLVVDDASTDEGPAKVRAIGDPRVRIITHPENRGRAAAANSGFDAAQGAYVAILDADDRMHPERIARQVAFLDAHPSVGACGSWARQFGEARELSTWPATDAECRARSLFGDPVLYGSAMFRRAVLDRHGLRCDTTWRHPGMDYLFTLSLAPFTQYANLQEELLQYRIGAQNMRHGSDPLEDRARLYRVVFQRMGIAVTEAEIDLQLMLHKFFRRAPDATQVRKLWQWMGHLAVCMKERALCDERLFVDESRRRWDRLFFALADRDSGAGLAHLRLSRDFRPARWRYLAAKTLRRPGRISTTRP